MTTPWLDKIRGVKIQDNGAPLSSAARVETVNFLNASVSYDTATGIVTVDIGGTSVLTLGKAAGVVTTTSITATTLFIASKSGMYRISQIQELAGTTVAGSVELSVLVNAVEVQDTTVTMTGPVLDANESMLIWLDEDDEVKYSVTLTAPNNLSCKWAVSAELLSAVP